MRWFGTSERRRRLTKHTTHSTNRAVLRYVHDGYVACVYMVVTFIIIGFVYAYISLKTNLSFITFCTHRKTHYSN